MEVYQSGVNGQIVTPHVVVAPRLERDVATPQSHNTMEMIVLEVWWIQMIVVWEIARV